MKKRRFFVSIKQQGGRFFIATVTMLALAGCGGGRAVPVVSGLPAGHPLVAQNALSTPNQPAHIATWAYDEYYANGANAPASAVQQWVTYAEAGRGNTKALTDCAASPKTCYSVYYFDPNFEYDSTTCPMQPDAAFISASSETSFVHEAGYADFMHRVQGSYTEHCKGKPVTIPVYLANQTDPGVAAWFQNYLQTNADAWDYYFMDDTNTVVLNQTYGPGGGFCLDSLPNHWCTTTQEYPTNSALASAHSAFAASFNHTNGMPMQFFFNGLSFSGQTPQNIQLISMGSGHFMGAICEACIVSAGTVRPSMFAPVLNAMAQVDALPSGAFVQLDTGASNSGTPGQIAQRTASVAITWLGYKEGHTVAWPDLEDNTKNLAVWPEDLIYPTSPVQTMSTGASDLAVAPGIYRREFTACFNNTAPMGRCAAIVNATTSSVTVSSAWLQQSYGHVLTISGGDMLSGGTVALATATFTPDVTTLGAGGALLLGQ